jgi:hypothetical protein
VSASRRLLLLLLAAVAVAAPFPVAAGADDERAGSGENVATATVTRDGGAAFDTAFSLVRQRGGAVDQLNAARSLARCADCRAVSIAFQVVLVSGTPSSLAPVNQAVAVNTECTRCTVYAGARQFVRITDVPVTFTRAGAATLLDVTRRLRALNDRTLTLSQLAAAVEAQEARVLQVLDTELVPAEGGGGPGDVRGDDRQADDDGSDD